MITTKKRTFNQHDNEKDSFYKFSAPVFPIQSKLKENISTDVCIIGSGAQVLGPVTVGCCAKIGANAVITKDVPEKAVMVGIPAKNVGVASEEFKPYGISNGDK